LDPTAGFAASLSLHERLFQLFIRAFYNAGITTPQLVVQSPSAAATLFLALPEFRIRRDPAPGFYFEFSGWGPMSTSSLPIPKVRRVKFHCVVSCTAKGTIESGELDLTADETTLDLKTYSFDPYTGSLFSPAEIAYLESDEFKNALIAALQAVFAGINQLLPPFALDALGTLASEPTLAPQLAYTDEALLVGLDVDADYLSTQGSAGSLTDQTLGNDVGVWIARYAVDPAYSDVKTQIEDEVVKAGASLESFRILPEEGHLAMSGSGTKSGGRVVFSFNAIPHLIRPGAHYEWDEEYGEHFEITEPDREELWFETTDIVVDIERPWWEPAVEFVTGVLTLGVGFFVIEGIVDMIRGNIENTIDSNEGSRGERNRQFTLPFITRPTLQLRLEEFESHPQGVYSGVRIRAAYWWRAELKGPATLSADEAAIAAPRFTLDLPADVLAADPELRVAWTIRRRDTNDIVLSRDTLAQGNLSISFDNDVIPFLEVPSVGIEVRLYRPLGAEVDEIFHENRLMPIVDYVDRSHPFVRWSHQAVVPIVKVEPDGSHTQLTQVAVGRNSAIHRTAIPGRCRMLRNYSLQRVLPKDGPPFQLEYLDQLPFPIEEIIPNRAVLCDYCFFGGPTKDVPLI
jgi:hypothetical protein